MSPKDLLISGARQNNLKNISLSIPHNRVVVITGVSGSGKSSLAFDTIFAEGQWRFVESLSTYARIFLEKLDRPDVDSIRNIRPAVALEQKNPVRGARSTVGTLTELYEFFRLLYTKVSTPFCPSCGKEVIRWDPSQVVRHLVDSYAGEKAVILFQSDDPPDTMRKKGFLRVWDDGLITDITDHEVPAVPGPFHVVLDRLVIRDEPRLADSVEMAWREGRGRVKVAVLGASGTAARGREFTVLSFSSANECEDCSLALPDPTAMLFSFNNPVGACPECRGFGNTLRYDEDLIIPDDTLSLSAGAVEPWNKPAAKWWKKHCAVQGKKAGLDLHKPYAEFTADEKRILFKGAEGFYGIDGFFEDMEARKYKLHVRVFLSRYRRGVTCPVCSGKRLRKEALAYRIAGLDIAELSRLPVSGAVRFFADVDLSPFRKDIARELLRQISMKLTFLQNVGLEYLTLDRYGKTLSGGEFQRINLSNQLASLLTGTLYVLDEPTVGLHARDTDRIAAIMKQLAELGNTVIVVEHDMGIIKAAEWIIELGPGGGHKGGEVVFTGTAAEFMKADTLTARYVRGREQVGIPHKTRRPSGKRITLSGARGNNLKGVDLSLPLGGLSVVTGVSGSGKSSLVVDTLYNAMAKKFGMPHEPALPFEALDGERHLAGIRLIDQSPIGRSPRSNPVTYLKVFDHIRKLFSEQREAKAYGYGPGFFSFNVPGGRCETCAGEGYELMEMFFFENLYVTCEKCGGRRYRPEVLRVRYKGKNISEVLHMTVEEGHAFFYDQPKICSKLKLMMDTGLGYLQLGQSATTLSGGEAQRLKICAEMGSSSAGNFLYILDEPTVGLHFSDVQALLEMLNRLVEAGNTVLVIEHNLDIVRAADWIIDLGPEGGDQGGMIIFEGTPKEIVRADRSYTGQYLKDYYKGVLIEK